MSTVLNMVELRPGGPPDLPLVDQMMTEAFDPRFGEAWTRGQCMGVLAMPGVWLTIASVDGRPAGFALARAIAGEAELLLLATRPAMQRRGVGRALLRSVVGECESRDVSALHLEVRSGNDAIGLYRAAGLTKVGERRGYYRGQNGKLFDAFTFRRTLR